MFFLAGLPQSSELCSELNLLIMLKQLRMQKQLKDYYILFQLQELMIS